MNIKVKRIIEILDLKPLSMEGGFYKETYRSNELILKENLPSRYQGSRSFSTAIYYLLTPESYSALHKLPTDEIFHFYMGDPVEMLQLYEDGTGKVITIGNNIDKGYYPQIIVPRNTWQGSKLIEGGEFALLGTTMSPSFEFEDFEPFDWNEVDKKYSAYSEMIRKLT
jgi:uncharacterized protein